MARKQNSNVRRRKRQQRRNADKNAESQRMNGEEATSAPLSTSRRVLLVLVSVLITSIPLLWMFDPTASNEETSRSNDSATKHNSRPPSTHHYEVLRVLPHDEGAFTQGLCFWDGKLYEGTGMHGSSELRQVDPMSGKVLARQTMAPHYFGEGIAHFEKDGETQVMQLTWKEKTAFVYRTSDLSLISKFSYETSTGEGWGITHSPTRQEFAVSDGSPTLMFWNDDDFKEKRRVQVTVPSGKVVPHLNELEWDLTDDTLLANVWYQNLILRIHPTTGQVIQVYDFHSLYPERTSKADSFNGIALTETPGELYVTGKYWPHLYRVKLLV